MLIEAARACLLVVDVQERLLPVMQQPERVVANCNVLIKAAEALDLPIIQSQQYPKGLGPTVAALDTRNAMIFDKLAFSVWQDDPLRAHFSIMQKSGFSQVIIGGIEAHVCVLQSAIDLKQAGFDVFVVANAISSRAQDSVDLALERMRFAGVEAINVEMAIFELAGKAGTPEFKALSALIK
ncbi:isochorismatase family protein [Aestuariivirga litoralis]|uniref:isochorismatase family protein n=1 Tax=Aestuariivirga litoralis TaxID=2650924 RepID=UPI0018C7BFB2|nr:isochorismatase family protein [Aestuariivirga litoralis]MBG1232476.1 isochorismatase family protein [Aestuariivirga litoralis]